MTAEGFLDGAGIVTQRTRQLLLIVSAELAGEVKYTAGVCINRLIPQLIRICYDRHWAMKQTSVMPLAGVPISQHRSNQ